jgi:hypothetical protein
VDLECFIVDLFGGFRMIYGNFIRKRWEFRMKTGE